MDTLLELLYSWFLGGENADTMWISINDGGLDGMYVGFWYLAIVPTLIAALFYFVLSKKASRAVIGVWVRMCVCAMVLTFALTWFVEASLSQQDGVGRFFYDRIILFSIINGVYAFLVYGLASIGFKRFSVNASHIPF